jgi:hypothetical protein
MVNSLSGSEPSKARLGIGQQDLGVVKLDHGSAVQDKDLVDCVSDVTYGCECMDLVIVDDGRWG